MTTPNTELLPKWECFCDEGYYHLWAVRPMSDKSFRSQQLFHVQSKEEAEALRDLLNTRTPSPSASVAEHDLREKGE